MHRLWITHNFTRRLKLLTKRNPSMLGKVENVIEKLREDPFDSGLRSHVTGYDPEFGNTYTSRVTGDIRIRWAFGPKRELILVLLDIGGHDDIYR